MTNLRSRRVSSDGEGSPKESVPVTPKRRGSRGAATPKTGTPATRLSITLLFSYIYCVYPISETKASPPSPTGVSEVTGPYKLESYEDAELAALCAAYAVPANLSRTEMLQQLNPYADGIMVERPRNLCVDPPPFTLKVIPLHLCFVCYR